MVYEFNEWGTGMFLASDTEWETPALWSIGLFPKTNDVLSYLHDGRARTLEEAILWHGGEGETSKQLFMQLTALERNKVIKFIQSL